MADIDTIPSVEEVEATVPPDIQAYEIVDGQVWVTMPATDPHQHVAMELGTDLTIWARETGAVVRSQPFTVRTSRTRRREPDLQVVLAEHRDRIGHDGMVGAPDLIVEVLSASTRRVDLGDKRDEYAAIGVRAYWCIDPIRGEAWLFEPVGEEPAMVRRGGVLRADALPGFAVPLDRVLPAA